jgi:DNA-binding winged helix-turn-helix (wHTH) protein
MRADTATDVRRVVSVAVLGLLEVMVAGRLVVFTAGRLQTLLAVLAMSAGETVSLDYLATAVWEGSQPADVRKTVQTYVTRLRAVLGAELIGTRPNGYVLHAEPDQVDALRFLRLVDAAEVAPDVRAERTRLEEALALWRGTPFEGLRSGWLADLEAPRLVERYLAAVERRADLGCPSNRGPASDQIHRARRRTRWLLTLTWLAQRTLQNRRVPLREVSTNATAQPFRWQRPSLLAHPSAIR